MKQQKEFIRLFYLLPFLIGASFYFTCILGIFSVFL